MKDSYTPLGNGYILSHRSGEVGEKSSSFLKSAGDCRGYVNFQDIIHPKREAFFSKEIIHLQKHSKTSIFFFRGICVSFQGMDQNDQVHLHQNGKFHPHKWSVLNKAITSKKGLKIQCLGP